MNLYQNNQTKKCVGAFKVGFDVLPGWAMDKVNSGDVKLIDTQEYLAKIGDVLIKNGDYVVNDGKKLTILGSDDFSENYSKVEYTDETAKLWEIKL